MVRNNFIVPQVSRPVKQDHTGAEKKSHPANGAALAALTTGAKTPPPALSPTVQEGEITRGMALTTARFPKGTVVNVRALGRWTVNGYYAMPHDFDLMIEHILRLDTLKTYHGIYCTLNPCVPDLAARGRLRFQGDRVYGPKEGAGDEEIVKRLWLPLDFDPERPSGISSTKAEQEQAIAAAVGVHDTLRDRFGFRNATVASSGNGAHYLHPLEAGNTDTVTKDIQHFLSAVGRMASELLPGAPVQVDTAVFNPARIWRIYGTTARKGEDTENRPHRMARILSNHEIDGVRRINE